MKYIMFRAAVFSMGASVLLGATAQAIEIRHTTKGNLGRDTFENQPLGIIPHGGGALPTPTPGPGSWVSDIAGAATASVVNAISPGPAQGARYVMAAKNGLVGGGNTLSLALDFSNDVSETDDGVITARFSTYIDSQGGGVDQSVVFAFKVNNNGTGADLAFLNFFENGNLQIGGTGSASAPTFVGAFTPDTWLSVEMEYTVVTGATNDTYKFQLWQQLANGKVVSTFAGSGAADLTGDDGGRPIRSIVFDSGNFAQWYVDGFVSPTATAVGSSNVVVDATAGISFLSESGAVHRLQQTPDLGGTGFIDTGAISIGDGSPQTLHDPLGMDTSKFYRVVK